MKKVALLLSTISVASAGDCSQYKTAATCLPCAESAGMCRYVVDPCASKTDCASESACHVMGNGCMSNTDSCNSVKECLNCVWDSGAGACQPKPQSLTSCDGNGETHCRSCEMANGKCSSTKNPCTGMEDHCAMMTPMGMCKMVSGECILAVDPCESAGYCGSCSWDSTAKTCSVDSGSIVTESCSANDEDGCLSCHSMNGMCMSNTDPCNGMESHCSSMGNCELKNNVCTSKVDPCAASTYCGDCMWKSGKCEKSDGSVTAAPVDHSQHLSSSGQMVMTFFDSHKVVILWEEIDVTDKGLYALAIIISFILPIIVMLLRDFVTRRTDFHLGIRMALMLVMFTMSNLVMLIVMIMNVGLFVSIMIGSTVGFGIVEFMKLRRAENEEHSSGSASGSAANKPDGNNDTECHYP
eukprot:TRINITY_DN817_c6_g1_i1.p1 TRINITY_DN817_c6_g1~~TRINITY_DN817_c6_g1_i1.p1  ORF type:complete len:411 (+),score=56.46 TRINITY_DN817_c6_g1_i1:72-1304(+)